MDNPNTIKNNSIQISKDSFADFGVNVTIIKRDSRTGMEIERREGHNRVCKLGLLGIIKFINGEYNPENTPLVTWDWIPRYLGVGTNIAGAGSTAGITSEVSFNDTRLLNEISPRILLPQRNTIQNRPTDPYIKLIIRHYLPNELYVGELIGEAGLFSKETGNNLWARIAFPPILKDEYNILELNWEISVISLESTNDPYTYVNKIDLRKAMNMALDKIHDNYANYDKVKLQKLITDLKDGIYDYGRADADQTTIDLDTETIIKDTTDIS